MNGLNTLSSVPVRLEKADRLDLRSLREIDAHAPAHPWSPEEWLTASRSHGAGVALAEMNGAAVGFALYRAADAVEAGRLRLVGRALWWCRRCWRRSARPLPLSVELLRIGVLPDRRRQGIGRALLQRIHREFVRRGGAIRATVPESELAVELLLRDAGYKAIRILRGHFGSEDGYVFERIVAGATAEYEGA